MSPRNPVWLCAVLALVSSAEAGMLAAQRTGGLPRPPGVRLATLPSSARPSMSAMPYETTVAIHPRNAGHVVVSYQQMNGGQGAGWGEGYDVYVAWSADGGETWATGAGTRHKEYLVSADPTVTIDPHGHAFMTYVGVDSAQGPYWARSGARNGLYLRRSDDGGRSWQPTHTPLIEYPEKSIGFTDKPYLVGDNHAESRYTGNLYVGWTRFSLDKSEILFTRSTDDGKSWSRPAVISTEPGVPRGASSGAVLGFHAAVGPDGTVYAIWTDGQSIQLTTSRDGGRTFAPSRRILNATFWRTLISGFPGANGLPTIAVDPGARPAGRVFVTWGDYRNGDMDIMASTSEDRGRTWSPPVRVNDDPRHNGKDQVLSWLAVDPSDGAAYVMFYDRRGDSANASATVTLARSTDGGRTFTNYAWTDTPTDPSQVYYGDYNGLVARDGRVYGSWTESVPAAKEQAASAAPKDRTLIRVGTADFRGSEGTRGEGAPRP